MSNPIAYIAQFLREKYNLEGKLTQLPGEKDLNFRLSSASGEYPPQNSHPAEPEENLALQIAALEHLHSQCRWAVPSEPIAHVQQVIRTKTGEAISTIQTPDGPRLAHLLTFIPGKLWAHCNPHTPNMLRSLGHALGSLDGALGSFAHPATQRKLKWDLAHANWIRDYLTLIAEPAPGRHHVERRLNEYESTVQPWLQTLRQQVIYNDANDYNIVVAAQRPPPPAPPPSERERGGAASSLVLRGRVRLLRRGEGADIALSTSATSSTTPHLRPRHRLRLCHAG